MVEKFISEGKIEAEQEVQLYIMILEMQVIIECLKRFQFNKINNFYVFLLSFFPVEKIPRSVKCHR